MAERGDIDLVSVVWQEAADVLRRYAAAIERAWLALPAERRGRWLLVENGGRPGAGDELAALLLSVLGEPLRISLPHNRGPAFAYNAAARAATGAYFALLDADGAPAPELFVKLSAALDDDERAAVAAAAVTPFAQSGERPLDPPREADWVSAGASLYRRQAFAELAGFDSELFAYACEEMDYGYRARSSGWRCLLVPGTSFRHEVDHKVSARRERIFFEHVMVWRHVHSSRRVTAKAWLAQLPMIAGVARRYGWRAGAGGLFGLFAYFRHIPAAERRRAQLRALRSISPAPAGRRS